MIKRDEKETEFINEFRDNLKSLLGVDFKGKALDLRVNAITNLAILTIDKISYHHKVNSHD